MRKLSGLAAVMALVVMLGCGGGGGAGDDGGDGGGGMEPLSFYEEQLAQKWHRYHSYDDSDEYWIFHSNRTACYFEISSSGSRRDARSYAHWELDEASPVGEKVFRLVTRKTLGDEPFYRDDEYHYLPNEFWQGGYGNLVMRPVSTSYDCE